MECLVQQICGGCPNLHRPIAVERSEKLEMVLGILGISPAEFDVPIYGAPQRTPYRSRIRMAVNGGVAGFFNQAKRDGCAVLVPNLTSAVNQIRQVSASYPELLNSADSIEVRVSSIDSSFGVFVNGVIDGDRLSTALGSEWKVASADYRYLQGLKYDLGDGLSHFVPLASFVQVNESVNRQLLSFVAGYVGQAGYGTFVDLYGGAGNYSAKLTSIGLTGSLLELDEIACASVSRTLPELVVRKSDGVQGLSTLGSADVVICNPPRAGIKKGFRQISSATGEAIIYVSCNPKTLAEDIAKFENLGWNLGALACFDMFPGTSHIETVAVLSPQ